jgi:hypothetical protein
LTGRLGEFLGGAVEAGARVGALVTEAAAERVALDADRLFPLASVRKVLTLGAYAVGAAGGAFDPGESIAVEDIERWYLPDTDGGAHRLAREWWGSHIVPLGAVTEAMVRFSDNASADYLLDRVGSAAVDAFARRMGMSAQEPILPALGEFRAWHRFSERWVGLGPGDRLAEAWRQAQGGRISSDDAEIDPDTQRRCAAVSCRGTPREWGSLMCRLAGGVGLPPVALDVIRRPLEVGGLAEDSAEGCFGRKGGDLPGVLTFAGYVRGRDSDRPEVAVVLFLENLAPDWQLRLKEAIPQNSSELLALADALSALE